jgi:hypothetical protein
MMGILGATWAVTGFSALILFALWRLTPLALDAFAFEMQWHHWAAMIVNILFMTYSEAYKGFHKAFSPRAAARAKYLLENPSWLHSLLAPLFVMCYFHSTRKRMIVSYALTAFIVVLIVIVHKLDQPWRGVVDAGVVIGLSLGLLSFWWWVARVFSGKAGDISPDMPGS